MYCTVRCFTEPVPVQAWMSPFPNYSNWPSIFWRPIFSRYPPKERPSFSRHCPRSSSVWALYVALSSLTLLLHQCIRPHRDGALFPRALPGRWVQGWPAPAVHSTPDYICFVISRTTCTDSPAVAPQISTAINANKIVHQLETLVNTEARLAITVTRLSAYLGQQLSLTTEI